MPILNLVHINIHVSDIEASIKFYGLLGWKVMFDLRRGEPGYMQPVKVSPLNEHGGGMTMGVVLSLGDDPRAATKIELIQYVDPKPSPRPFRPAHQVGVHRIAMRVKDIDATVADFRAKGILIPEDPHEIRSMNGRQRYVLFPDPDENILELIELYRA
jgi:catechol 2,3-dioxygenase-like lactoylglutathione lyase family enzyme